MWIAIALGAVLFFILLLWVVQIVSPSPWERKRRRRERGGRLAGRQAPTDRAIARFNRNRR